MKRLFFVLFIPIWLSAQPADLKNFDYSRADSIALHFPKKKYKTVSEVAAVLTENLNTEHEKFRVIFRWITDNIEYNKSAQNVADADKVVRKNKAVCQGFSNLLKEMCAVASIPCEIITGYTKTEANDINRKLKKTDHAWNCVKLYGKWYLVDVTWATSKLNVVTHKFQKEFDAYYFLTPPEKFILDHLPAPPTKEQAQTILKEGYTGNLKYYFQFLDKPVKKKTFTAWPVYYTDYFHLGLTDINPGKGKLSWNIEKPFKIEVSSDSELKDAAVLVNTDKYVTPVPLKKDAVSGKYYIEYTFPQAGPADIVIYFNGLCMAEYVVKVK
jgi:hypothetical protein